MPARQQRQQRRAQRRRQQQQEFHLFGLLPTELRLQIWVDSWEPRTVSIFPKEGNNTEFLRDRDLHDTQRRRLPASAYVNSESRSETLRYYKRCFAQRDKAGFLWFNHRLDTLCMASMIHLRNDCTGLSSLQFLNPDDLRTVQRMVLPEIQSLPIEAATPCPGGLQLKPVTDSFESPRLDALLQEHFPSLREITLVTGFWLIFKCYDSEPYMYLFSKNPGVRLHGPMRTTYLGKLRIRHSPACLSLTQECSRKAELVIQRYGCRLSETDVEPLEQAIEWILL